MRSRQAAEHVAVRLHHAAFLMQQIDCAAQLFMGGQDGHLIADAEPHEPQHETHHALDGERDRPEQRDEPRDGPRHGQRDRIRPGDRRRFRHHLSENNHQHGNHRVA